MPLVQKETPISQINAKMTFFVTFSILVEEYGYYPTIKSLAKNKHSQSVHSYYLCNAIIGRKRE
jgi:hypothetical protein